MSICVLIIISIVSSAVTLAFAAPILSVSDPYMGGSIALLIYSICWGCFAFALLGMHTFLLATDQTTYDLMRPKHKAEVHHFSCPVAMRSFLSLCQSVSPSLVREYYMMPETVKKDKLVAKEMSPIQFMALSTVKRTTELGDVMGQSAAVDDMKNQNESIMASGGVVAAPEAGVAKNEWTQGDNATVRAKSALDLTETKGIENDEEKLQEMRAVGPSKPSQETNIDVV